MKTIKATPVLSGVLAAVMWLVSVSCHADTEGEKLFACRDKLLANGVSGSAKVVLAAGYCYAPASCPKVDSNVRTAGILMYSYEPNSDDYPMAKPTYTAEQRASAKPNLPTSCSECTSGGKPKCLKL